MKQVTYGRAIGEGIAEEMRRDRNVYIIGESVGPTGNIFKVLEGLYDEFGPERVRDTPLAEEIIINAAVGSAMVGARPVAEIMYSDFISLGIDCLVNQGAKSLFNSAGRVKVPMVLRSNIGAGPGRGSHHTQSLEAWFAHVPGLKVVLPSTPHDAKGLIKSAIRDDYPVVFLEHKLLYFSKGMIPEDEYTLPIGKADIKRPGKDVTIISYSRMLLESLKAAETLAKEGIDAEVVDLMSLAPLDRDAILSSVKKTNNAVVVSEECKSYGVAAEICTLIQEEVFDYLDSPVKRVTALDTNIPYAPNLLEFIIPTPEKIVGAVKEVLR